MPTLPSDYLKLVLLFAPLSSRRIWDRLQVLLRGAIFAPGQRTVTAGLRITGLSQEKHCQNYHRLLHRATWSRYQVNRVLLG